VPTDVPVTAFIFDVLEGVASHAVPEVGGARGPNRSYRKFSQSTLLSIEPVIPAVVIRKRHEHQTPELSQSMVAVWL
jgi:hypothetical protein